MQYRISIRHPGKSPLLLAAILAGLFIAATLAYAIYIGNTLRYQDEADYLRLARNLAATGHYTLDGFTPTACRPPAYPVLLAAGMKLGLPLPALRVANASSLLICMALLFMLLRKSSVAQARIAVLLVMAYPVLIYAASLFYPQIPAAALFLTAVLLLFSDINPGPLRCLFAGVLLGTAILMVSTFGFTLLFTCVFFACRSPRPVWMRNVAVMIIGASLILTPWIVRNALVFGRFIPVATNNGISLFTGNNEHTTANSGVTEYIAQSLETTRYFSEVDADDRHRRAALDFVRVQPRAAFMLYLEKVANYYNYRNELTTQSESSPQRDLIMLGSYGLLLAAAIARICLAARHPLSGLERYVCWLYFLNGFFSAVYFTRIRFRLPMDMLLIVLASATIAMVANRLVKRTDKTGAAK